MKTTPTCLMLDWQSTNRAVVRDFPIAGMSRASSTATIEITTSISTSEKPRQRHAAMIALEAPNLPAIDIADLNSSSIGKQQRPYTKKNTFCQLKSTSRIQHMDFNIHTLHHKNQIHF
jgi:hypothetical protein